MSIWFEGSQEIATNLSTIQQALENLGTYFVGIVKLMPGLTLVELVEEGPNFVKYYDQRRAYETLQYFKTYGRCKDCACI